MTKKTPNQVTDQKGHFKTFDGTKLFFSVEGSGPPLVFCYGLVCSNLHWSYQIEHFKKTHTVIWFDYRGHHKSNQPAKSDSYTIATFAEDLYCLLQELKIPMATVLGHSMGVNVVLDLYKKYPEKVKAMVLANGSARNPMETFFGSNLLQYVIPALSAANERMPLITRQLWKSQGHSWLTQKLIAWVGFSPGLAKESDIKTYIEQFSSMDLTMTLAMMQDYEKYDALSWLHHIQCPTLLISGENDKVIPKAAQELMHQLIPGSEYELVRNGSHCPQMDIPQLANMIIERFLTKHGL
jgi:pimeloyl-ACP methyl ester carboxylesterase